MPSASAAATSHSKTSARADAATSTRSTTGTRATRCTVPAAANHCEAVRRNLIPDLLGAHVSIAGGTHLAPERAEAIGATVLQIFTKMAQRWAERACQDDECIAFRRALAPTRIRVTMAHDSYLINLASPDEALRRQSI